MNKFMVAPKTQNGTFVHIIIKIMPWLLSLLLASSLVIAMLLFKLSDLKPEETVTIRKIDIALPLPPPPPPPMELEQTNTESSSASIDLLGMGEGPKILYSDTPKLERPKKAKLKLPKFDMNSLNFGQTISIDFPILEVKSLDRIPEVISSKFVPPPKEIIRMGIKRIPTEVEIIIDQQGKPFIKRIIDPIYPEMIETIREWVKHARFTVPKKNGLPVQAVYSYKINFNYGR
jgi:hypothetical protein